MIVTYGRRCPKGYLPAFSVNTEEEAKRLIERTCGLVTVGSNYELAYAAQELVEEQSLENLYAFGHRLAAEYEKMLAEDRG